MRLIYSLNLFLLFVTCAHAEIFIGVAGPMTGTYASFGAQMVAGVQAAADELNARGGVEGELLEVITADDGCDSKQAEIAARTLIDKNVRVVIGHFCSYSALAAGKIYEAAGLPMIVPSATLPVLTESGLTNIVRLASRDDAQGAAAADFIKQKWPQAKVAFVSDESAASIALRLSFKSSNVITFKPDTRDASAVLAALKAGDYSVIYCACSASDAGFFAQAMRGAGLKMQMVGPDTLLVPQFWEKSGVAGEGTWVSFASDPQASLDARAVLRTLKAENVPVDGATLPAYAATQLFAQAAEKIGSQNGRSVVGYLRSGRSHPTVLGARSFDSKGDVQPQRFVWYKWSNGKYAAESLGN